MKQRMRATVDRIEALMGGPTVTSVGIGPTLLDIRDFARDEGSWIRAANDGSELALQYRMLMASVEIRASNVLALWPSDPPDHPAAKDLSEVMVLLFRDFRDVLNEGEPPRGH
jgi:hypothetical protein